MRGLNLALAALTAGIAYVAAGPAAAQNVKVTPLGSHDGEFCRLDRAMVFEDPDGTRILYDAGRTVAGADDARLGDIDAVLLSHVHGDHLGDRHIASTNAGACGKPEFPVVDAPVSNSVKIVVAKKAKFIVGAEMASFFAAKVKNAGGDPKQVLLARYGASRQVGGVTIATVPAVHSNGLNAAFIDDKEHAAALKASGLTAYVGPPSGYVLSFSNGLVVYLSGDTGVTAEQDLVVRQYYGAKLAVINIGDVFTTGPTEAAHVMNNLVKPRSVIPSHANELATQGGKVVAGSRTDTFIKAVKASAHLPLSGRTMEFDHKGRCVSGC
jgi:L-ascorbate metabolism protein UlaG (beta-lactamase superfamily)